MLCSLIIVYNFFAIIKSDFVIDPKFSKIWGPGLHPQQIIMPARYFFIQVVDITNKSFTANMDFPFDVAIGGISKRTEKLCRTSINILNRKDSSFIVRYKVYEPCINFKISVKYKDDHVDKSPYIIEGDVHPDDCSCQPNEDLGQFLDNWGCGSVPQQIVDDLVPFSHINWDVIRLSVITKFDQPHSVSLCHYILKHNVIYRKCYGKYVGFKMFMDSILLSLSRKTKLPDLEFFINLGDWPLVKKGHDLFPIFSWCGSKSTNDIVLPTYDITESTLENMGRVMLDMLSVQGNVNNPWKERIPKAFWRGRDSNQERLDLIDISRSNPDLFNVSLTNFFFFREKQEEYGPKTEHISFFNFFDYKYQLAIDGTVAAYRFPYLLGGGSLIIKQESQYYEHFYNDLIPNTHYITMKRDLSDLVEKIKWAINHDEESQEIANNGRLFADKNLLPQSIFCYHAHLLNEFSKRIKSNIQPLPGMERVNETKHCDCTVVKDEL